MNGRLVSKLLRDLRQTAAQTAALIAIVAIGILSFLAPSGAYRNLSASYERTYRRLRFADLTFSVQQAPAKLLGQISSLEGVAAVTGRLVFDTALVLGGGESKQLEGRLIGLPVEQRPLVDDLLIIRGRYFQPGDTQAAILETQFASAYGLSPGDRLDATVRGRRVPFQVIGTAASAEYLDVVPSRYAVSSSAHTFGVLFVPLPTLEKLLGSGINSIAVLLRSGADQRAVRTAIQNLLTPYGLQGVTPRAEQPSNADLKLDLKAYQEVSRVMPSMILAVAASSLFLMLSRQVRAQRQQVGLMKALGYTNASIIGQYLGLALIVGFAGSLVGIALGIPLELWMTSLYAGKLGIPLIEVRFYVDLVVEAVALSIVIALLAGLFPALRSARLPPAGAMRPSAGTTLPRSRRTLMERLVGLPRWLLLPLRNVFRAPRRLLTTGLGVIFSFALVLAPWAMLSSAGYEIRQTFQVVERWDIMAAFNKPQTSAVLQEIRGFPGVKEVIPALAVPVILEARGTQNDILLKALPARQQMHHFRIEAGVPAERAMAAGELVLATGIRRIMGLEVGDKVTLSTPVGSHRITIGSSSLELLSAVGYVGYSLAQKWTGVPLEVFNAVYLKAASSQAQSIRTRLFGLPDISDVELRADNERSVVSSMGLFHLFMGILLAASAVMSFALLFNAMTINVLERERELATMRAVGSDRGSIRALVLLENVAMWLLTLAPGLLLGYWVALQVGHTFRSQVFWFEVHVSALSYVVTALAILLTMVLASLPAIGTVNRLDLAEATKVVT
jgi:putative ABC transport system permease protein